MTTPTPYHVTITLGDAAISLRRPPADPLARPTAYLCWNVLPALIRCRPTTVTDDTRLMNTVLDLIADGKSSTRTPGTGDRP